jgi:arylformamidase
MIYDITRKVTPQLAVWPGDTPYQPQQVLDKQAGSSVNLVTLHLSAHTGTHADAAWHYDQNAARVDQMPLESYLGPARVITLKRTEGGITPDEVAGIDFRPTPRVLFHSVISDQDGETFPTQFPYLTVELIDHLADQGVVLIGLDSPSVDAFDSKTLDCHHRLLARRIVNLETLLLAGVPDGVYELIALPLRLEGACASPVRAVLRPLSASI